MKKVLVFFADGFEEIEALATVDLLRRAEIETVMVSITGNIMVTGSHGVKVETEGLFEETAIDDYDFLVLPGGSRGADTLRGFKPLHEKLIQFYEQGKGIGAICAGPETFGSLGLLEGKKATCYPGCDSWLKGAEYHEEAKAVTDGNIITGKAAGTTLDFAAQIIEWLEGKERADEVLASIYYER